MHGSSESHPQRQADHMRVSHQGGWYQTPKGLGAALTAKLNGVDPRAWLADVLARIADHRASRLHELLPWNWKAAQASPAAEAA
jgi:hypothetical protein